MDLFQRPPDALDVLGVHRDVGVVEVDPVAHAVGEFGEGVDVTQHRFAALRVEFLDAVLLDVFLAGEAQFLLDGEFDGQAVAVPTGLAVDAVAAHRLVAGEKVLEDTGLDVVRAGHAVGRRGAFVEGPGVGVLGAFNGLLEGLLFIPQLEHCMLERGEIHLGVDRAVRHRGSFVTADWDEGTSRSPRYHPP